jgi:hypothetical protein
MTLKNMNFLPIVHRERGVINGPAKTVIHINKN